MGRVPTADAAGDEAELQALLGLVEPPFQGTVLGKKMLEFSQFCFVIKASGQTHTSCFFHLVLTPRSSCGHPHVDVLRLPLRTGHGLFAQTCYLLCLFT